MPRARAAAAAPYLKDLNPEQREAVETLDGPVLVLAGAGTGKTRVLTTRIAHILATARARPGDILSVTFTNKAAREMKQRVGAMVGQVVEGMPWLGTFHSIGVKILRRHAELVGLKPDFTILDVDDQIRLLKQLLEAENIDEKRWPARVLAGLLDSWKNRGLTPDQVPAGKSAIFASGKGKKLYAAYQERLKISTPPTSATSCSNASGCCVGTPSCCGNIRAGSASFSSTSIKTPTSRSISGCGCWRSGANQHRRNAIKTPVKDPPPRKQPVKEPPAPPNPEPPKEPPAEPDEKPIREPNPKPDQQL